MFYAKLNTYSTALKWHDIRFSLNSFTVQSSQGSLPYYILAQCTKSALSEYLIHTTSSGKILKVQNPAYQKYSQKAASFQTEKLTTSLVANITDVVAKGTIMNSDISGEIPSSKLEQLTKMTRNNIESCMLRTCFDANKIVFSQHVRFYVVNKKPSLWCAAIASWTNITEAAIGQYHV